MTGIGNRRRKFKLRPIYLALWDLGTQFPSGLHSFSGADITGTVALKGNLSFWKAFKDCDMEIKQAVLEDHIVRQLDLIWLECFSMMIHCIS